jgi:glucosamine-6-phosphate deaminase
MSIRQILKSKHILAIVPDARKATAVQQCLEGEIIPMHPASILREHSHTTIYLDTASASRLSKQTLETHTK